MNVAPEFLAEAARLNAAYAAERARYRAEHPERGVSLDERAVYVCPPELRPRLPLDGPT